MSLDAASYEVLWQISDETGIRPEWLLPCLQEESGLNPAALNSLGYAGINQINAGFLANIGVTPADYVTWPASEQLRRVVLPYMQGVVNRYGPLRSATRVEQANFLPATLTTARSLTSVLAASGSAIYNANSGLDLNHNGAITVQDLADMMAKTAATSNVRNALAATYAIRPGESQRDPVYGDDFGMSHTKAFLLSALILAGAAATAYYIVENESPVQPIRRFITTVR
jgi:hypothetical protein